MAKMADVAEMASAVGNRWQPCNVATEVGDILVLEVVSLAASKSKWQTEKAGS